MIRHGWLPGLALCLAIVSPALAAEPDPDFYSVGVAAIDITPGYPIRLGGFGGRRTESEGITQRIKAEALVIDDGEPAVLITVDSIGVPAHVVEEVARRLHNKVGISRVRFALTATHSHTAPMLDGMLRTLFGVPIPEEHQEHITRYTAELTDKLENIGLRALADRKPAKLSWTVGSVPFAVNRRTRGGPVDRDLPLLVVHDLDGKIRAVYVSYACHCVTLSNNKISGDWAGFAKESIMSLTGAANVLLSIGCGADANPDSGVAKDRVDLARAQGAQIGIEVKRLLAGRLTPVRGKLTAKLDRFVLPLDQLPTRAEWQERAKRKDAVGYHAHVQLERLDRGEKLANSVPYSVQTWSFGKDLAMVFLPGEVVVDYSLRLKRELDPFRLWINAYANDIPCYIASERILREGGYEGGSAMTYYDLPARLKPGVEERIVRAVRQQLDTDFTPPYDARRVHERPLAPDSSRALIQTKKDLRVELVVAEPAISSPVAIDYGPDGKLWVAEMADYPAGAKGDFVPGGRIRLLQSTKGDGKFDRSTIFLDNIPFPTGVTVWRKGILVCAAPDILYAEDTKGDGKAHVVRKLYSGFGTHNYQARVNSLCYGLDGWVYGSCGLFGGQIKSFASDKPFMLGDRDFRIKPDTGEIEATTGRTQQGLVRDDWGNWFGCDNSELARHYVLADHYLRRNPHVLPPDPVAHIVAGPEPNRLYPINNQLQLFKLSGPPGLTTAACGIGVYRDDLLGSQYQGDLFTCEPVNLLVHRMKLKPQGSTFSAERAADETHSEFLASTDNWFRPVQMRTGPDGAIWIVDMYRYVIEHPRWIPPEDLAKVDVRAGSSMGRIYRIVPKDGQARPWLRLDKLDTAGLVSALDTPNGWQRDMATQMLIWRKDTGAAPGLEKQFKENNRPETRLHDLCALDGLGELKPALVGQAFNDRSSGIRRHALRLAEPFSGTTKELTEKYGYLGMDLDAQVRLQLACSYGMHASSAAGQGLAELIADHPDDPYLQAAVLSSLSPAPITIGFEAIVLGPASSKFVSESLIRNFEMTVAANTSPDWLSARLRKIVTAHDGRVSSTQMAALGGMLDALERKSQRSAQLLPEAVSGSQLSSPHVLALFAAARLMAVDSRARETDRVSAINLLGREPNQQAKDLLILGRLLTPQNSTGIQSASLASLARIQDDRTAKMLLDGWRSYSPALKSPVFDLLLSRPAWKKQLLAGLNKGTIPSSEVDAARRQQLLESHDAELRAVAARIFNGAINSNRQKVVENYRMATTLQGDAKRGLAIFGKNCSVCHRLHDVGFSIGPDLAALANKTPQYLLTEILDPNKNVDSRYIEYIAVTKAGRTFTGTLASETATSITLLGQEGKRQILLRSELEDLQSTGKSLMPEGLEKDINKEAMADLIAFLTAR